MSQYPQRGADQGQELLHDQGERGDEIGPMIVELQYGRLMLSEVCSGELLPEGQVREQVPEF